MPKPTDLFIGVVEFFAVLVPGVVALMVVGWVAGLHLPEKQEAAFFGAVLAAGFVLGHILHGLGSFLDVWLYDPLFKPLEGHEPAHGIRGWSYFRTNDKVYRASECLITVGDKLTRPVGVYQWVRAWLRIHSPEATTELDRLEADSKLFRSLSVIAVAILVCWKALPAAAAGFLPLAILTMLVCLWRYCDLRQKMVRAAYLHFVLLRSDAISHVSRPRP